MKRRDFIKSAVVAGAAAIVVPALPDLVNLTMEKLQYILPFLEK